MKIRKQLSRGVVRKECSENMQQIYRKTPMPKCHFSEVALQSQQAVFSFSKNPKKNRPVKNSYLIIVLIKEAINILGFSQYGLACEYGTTL